MRHRRLCVLALLAAGLLPGAASAAPKEPGELWGLSVQRATAGDLSAGLLARARSSGITALALRGRLSARQRRDIRALARGAGLDVLAPRSLDARRRRGVSLSSTIRSACATAIRRDSVCTLSTGRRSTAVAGARTGRAGVILLRLGSPASVPALARAVRRGRVLAVVDLVDGRAPAATWRLAIRAALVSPTVDLAVQPRGARRGAALDAYLAVVSEALATARPGPPAATSPVPVSTAPPAGPTVPGGAGPAPPPPTTAVLWVDDSGGSCTRRSTPGEWSDAEACGTFAAAFAKAQPGDNVLVRCVLGSSCTFAPETLSGTRGASAPVTFLAAQGFSVGFEELPRSSLYVWLDDLRNVTFRDIGFGRNNSNDTGPNLRIDCARDLTLINASGRRFYMFEGNARVSFIGGDWGGYSSSGEEDSTMGTTGAAGPQTTCTGDGGPRPQTDILFDGVRFHDVFWIGCSGAPGACNEWGGAHPDCFEINGYVDGVVIRNSIFERCGNTMLSLYTDQGDVKNVIAQHNTFRSMSPNSYFGIQWVRGGATPANKFFCDGSKFLNNTYTPDAPNGWLAYTPPRFECDSHSGHGIEVSGNTIQRGPGTPQCTVSKGAPFYTTWKSNTFTHGDPCT